MNITLTQDQQNILVKFKKGENLLVLGDSGTGKSTLISHIVETAKTTGRKAAVTATTGIAAQLIGGRTIHKLLRYYPRMDYECVSYDEKTEYIEDVDLIIVDEISMMGRHFTDYFYKCLRHVNHPIQLVFFGDFFQLPPVRDTYAFTSPFWDSFRLQPCALHQVIRQQDAEFVHNITLLKYGDKRCLKYLLSHSNPFPLKGQISICATRQDAEAINRAALESLGGAPQAFLADYEGEVADSDISAEKCLELKPGMRAMSLINGSHYSNGSLGTVIDLDATSVKVLFDNGYECIFTQYPFTAERTDKLGETTTFMQIPLRAASAITIHKSQGQTFGKVNIDGRHCWAPGQLYVAVSRARSIEGIHFLTPIRSENIKTDPAVINFINDLTDEDIN